LDVAELLSRGICRKGRDVSVCACLYVLRMCLFMPSSDDDDKDVDEYVSELVESCTSKNDDGNVMCLLSIFRPAGFPQAFR